jgi:hypothetical protein
MIKAKAYDISRTLFSLSPDWKPEGTKIASISEEPRSVKISAVIVL